MSLIELVIARAPAVEDPAPILPNRLRQESNRLANLEHADKNDTLEEPDGSGTLELEPVYTVIDYRDGAGTETRRRITLRKLQRGPHAPIVHAVCHERRAIRCFRCDRIDGFLEPDGEVIEPERFFREVLGINLQAFSLSEESKRARTVAGQILEALRSELSILAAAARCDGDFHIEELDAIQRYAEREALDLQRLDGTSVKATVEALDQLGAAIGRLRPWRTSIPSHFKNLKALPDDAQRRFFRALADVVSADGKVVLDEHEFLAELGDGR